MIKTNEYSVDKPCDITTCDRTRSRSHTHCGFADCASSYEGHIHCPIRIDKTYGGLFEDPCNYEECMYTVKEENYKMNSVLHTHHDKTYGGPLGDPWGTPGGPLGELWGTPGGPLGHRWGPLWHRWKTVGGLLGHRWGTTRNTLHVVVERLKVERVDTCVPTITVRGTSS